MTAVGLGRKHRELWVPWNELPPERSRGTRPDPDVAALVSRRGSSAHSDEGRFDVHGPPDGEPHVENVHPQTSASTVDDHIIGALIRGGTGRTANSVQYDALFGPNYDMTLPRNSQPGCRCQTGRDLHERVRVHRQRATARLVDQDKEGG